MIKIETIKGAGKKAMEEDFQIFYEDKTGESAWGIIGRGVGAFNEQQAGDDHSELLCFVVKSQKEEIVGGLVGSTHWDWLYVDLLWVREDLRGKGYGNQLLTMAEDEARERGAKNAYLDTFSFQAPDFYKQHGYEVFGELEDFPTGHRRFYMRKAL